LKSDAISLAGMSVGNRGWIWVIWSSSNDSRYSSVSNSGIGECSGSNTFIESLLFQDGLLKEVTDGDYGTDLN